MPARLTRFLTPLCLAVGTAMAQDAPDLRERLAACAACHGEHGEGVALSEYAPHLAGKPAGYLFAQMRAFRDGLRDSAQMTWLLQFMDDAYLHEIAAYYAAQPPHTRAAVAGRAPLPAAQVEEAERLVHDGDAAAGLPACAACHGERLSGLEPGIPALVGLPEDYLVAQLGAWRSGARRAAAPDCMAEVARALSPAQMRTVAAWLSRQSPGDADRPAAAGRFVPPRRCGSLDAQVRP